MGSLISNVNGNGISSITFNSSFAVIGAAQSFSNCTSVSLEVALLVLRIVDTASISNLEPTILPISFGRPNSEEDANPAYLAGLLGDLLGLLLGDARVGLLLSDLAVVYSAQALARSCLVPLIPCSLRHVLNSL